MKQGGSMFINPNLSHIEEVIRKGWTGDKTDASLIEDSSWEILNEDNSQDVLNRHWFKQNYINPRSQLDAEITYH
jgi:hypothetical protein